MHAKQFRYNVIKDAFANAKSSLTIEEIECERRGYKLTKTILGSGAYAKVKMAYVLESKQEKNKRLADDLHSKGHNIVAVKIVSKRQAPQEYLQKFMPREIDALNATCRHYNVIQLYETFYSNDKIFLVMEYASKGDLLDYINSRCRRCVGIGEDLSKNFFRQLIEGVSHCHRRNVVHRDLKCENILIDDNNVIKISDFGFATRAPSNKTKYLETFCGSYAYAAPEILQAHKYDGKAADMWSLGVILYAMLCGKLPYNDNCSLSSLIVQTRTKITFPVRGACSQESQQLVRSILRFDPLERISTSRILVDPWLNDGRTESPLINFKRGTPVRVLTPSIESWNQPKAVAKKPPNKDHAEPDVEKVPKFVRIANKDYAEPDVDKVPKFVRIAKEETDSKTPEPADSKPRTVSPVVVSGMTLKNSKPKVVPVLLHNRGAKLSSKLNSPTTPQPMPVTPTDDRRNCVTPVCVTPVSGRETPCERFTADKPRLIKKFHRKELPIKMAEIVTGQDNTSTPNTPEELNRETFIKMNRALQANKSYKRAKSDMRNTRQQVWRYVHEFSHTRSQSVPPKASKGTTSPSVTTVTPTPPPDQPRPNRGVAPWGRVISHRLQQRSPVKTPQRKRGSVSPAIAKNNALLSSNMDNPYGGVRGSIYKGLLRQHFASSGGHSRSRRGTSLTDH